MIRACTPQEIEKWIKFLNKELQYTAEEGSYAVDFAPLFTEEALKRSRLLYRDENAGDILASAMLYPVKMKMVSGKELKVGIISAVATASDERGRGYASQIIAHIIDNAIQEKLDAVVLWSDKNEFYSKFDFKPFPSQEIYILAPFVLEMPSEPSRYIVEPGWSIDEVTPLYELHRVREFRTKEYWDALQKIRSCKKYQCRDQKTGRVLAYLGFDRGKDMKSIIHEWGYGPGAEGLMAMWTLLKTVLNIRPELHWMTNPNLRDGVRDFLLTRTQPVFQGDQGLMKVINEQYLPMHRENEIWFWGLDSL